jgi:recombinational DNA repair protein RecT
MNGTQTTAIAVTDEKILQTTASWGREYLLPFYHGTNFDAWLADVGLAIVQNENLRNCMNNPADALKLVRALQLNAASGLSLNPQHGQAALVAYNGKKGLVVNHIVMKNGYVKKAMQTRKVVKVESGTVYANDAFKVVKSSDGDGYKWEPSITSRGKPFAYFACIHLDDGKKVLEFRTHEQVWEHALKYGNGRKWDDAKKIYMNEFYPDSAWGKSFDGMAEKTVIKIAFNNLYLPESEEIFAEEDRRAEEMRDVTEPPAKGTSAEGLAAELANREETPPQTEPQAAATQETAPKDDALF